MSSRQVETVTRMVAAWNETLRDAESGGVASVYELMTDDFTFVPAIAGQLDRASVGRDGFEIFSRQLAESWTSFEIEPQEYRDLDDRVVVVGRVLAEGRGSGLSLDQELDSVFWFSGEKVAQVRSFLSLDEALGATRETTQGGSDQ